MTCAEPGCRRQCLSPHTKCVNHRPKLVTTHNQSPESKARSQAKRQARRECPYCWTVGAHDPLCKRQRRSA